MSAIARAELENLERWLLLAPPTESFMGYLMRRQTEHRIAELKRELA